ncbi:methyltransferase domain-containing protein [Streptomyces sp. NPDC127051]|uniref:methyltransferase domain-containing protein n=1 Tax=Streptomyces sp. NPDC127051 TaxID=3347119 RepID=UPI0036655EB3
MLDNSVAPNVWYINDRRAMEARPISAKEFTDVDSAPEANHLLDFLIKIDEMRELSEIRAHTFQDIPSGMGVDIGCGAGGVVAELTARGYDVVGVDASSAAVAQAHKRFPHCRFMVGNSYRLPFGSGSLAWYRAERVFIHLSDPVQAFAEAYRVLAQGGRITLVDPDFDSVVYSSTNTPVTRAVVRSMADSIGNGKAGSRSPQQLASAGFSEISTRIIPLTFTDLDTALTTLIQPSIRTALEGDAISHGEACELLDELTGQYLRGAFLASVSMFITTATRCR